MIKRNFNRYTRRVAGRLLDALCVIFDLFSQTSSKVTLVRKSLDFEKSSRFLVFVFYGPIIMKRHLDFLNSMSKKGIHVVVVSNGCENIGDNQLLNLSIVRRKNIGRDLAAYRDAIRIILDKGEGELQYIFLINDTMTWDDRIIDCLLARFDSNIDVLSITKSYQIIPHIQTFGLLVRGSVASRFVKYSNWRNWKLKRTIVFRGEIMLQRRLENHGLRVGSLIDGEALQKKYLRTDEFPLNPTNELADHLAKEIFGIRKIK